MINGLSRTNPRIRRSRQLRSLEPLEGRLLLATSLGSELAGASILSIPADVTTGVVGPSTSTFFRIEPNAESLLVAEVQAPGSVTQLSLLDDQGNLLVQSDGQTVQDANDLIDQDVSSGTYYLEIQGLGGTAAFTLTTAVTASSTPYEPTPLNLPLPPAIPSPPATGPSSPFSGVPSPFTIPTLPAASTSTGSTAPAVISLSIPPATPSSSTTNPGNTGASSFNNEFDPRNVPAMTSGVFLSDGVLDLADPDGILPGAGDGTFGLPTSPLPIAAKPADVTAMATGDFNDDGRLDLVVASFAHVGQVQILLGSGNGTFDAEPPIDLGAFYPSYLAVGDFEGDGNLGVAIAGTDTSTGGGVVEALSGDGKGGLQPPVSMPMGLGYTPVSMVTGDFTSDGRSDIAVEEKGTEVDVVMMLSNGDGTFQSLPPTSLGSSFNFLEIGGPSGYGNMVAGNFGGGNLDLAVAGSGLFSGGFVMVLPGAGNGRFGTAASIPLGSMSPTSLAVGDFGGDGELDLAVAESGEDVLSDSGNVVVLQGNGALGFTETSQIEPVDFRPGTLVAGDFNGDGRLDLEVEGSETPSSSLLPGLTWQSCFQILPGNGNGTFVIPQDGQTGTQGQAEEDTQVSSNDVVTGDFNNDGRLDLVDCSQTAIQLFLGNGNGTFGAPDAVETLGSGMTIDGIISGNFYGDGNLDLAVLVTLPHDEGLQIQVFPGNGDGTFGKPTITDLGPFSSIDPSTPSLVAGEFDGNHLTDLVVYDGTSLEVLLSEGDGTFGAPTPLLLQAPAKIEDLMVGDFDGEEHPSLAFLSRVRCIKSFVFGSTKGACKTFTPTEPRFPRFFRYFVPQSPKNHDFYPRLLLDGVSIAM